MRFDTDQISADILRGEKAVLVLDGDCLLCNNLARWLSQHDKRGSLLFATIADYKSTGAATPENTALLLTNGKIYTRSAAVLTVLQKLGISCKLARFFLLCFPKTLRDAMYHYIASRRLKISSTIFTCKVVDSTALKKKILSKDTLMSLLLNLTNRVGYTTFTQDTERNNHLQT